MALSWKMSVSHNKPKVSLSYKVRLCLKTPRWSMGMDLLQRHEGLSSDPGTHIKVAYGCCTQHPSAVRDGDRQMVRASWLPA